MEREILSVSQINEYIRRSLDADPNLTAVAVRGEISNYKCYPSGHHYFTLKDENGALKCVMFKGNALHLRFRPENGMQVIAMGKITVYPRDGVYQLYCTAMVPDGVGDLHTAFEQLKKKLSAQGLFDAEHKKPIPAYPKIIGIVTSSAGAALQDMLRILRARYPLVQVRLLPVRVQGAEAPGEIAAAIAYADAHNLADVLIVGRGGGSIEDLWAFNDEQVAHAIYNCSIPVISAVGHEPDVTISDYVADLRAATPSNAAELVVPDREALQQSLDGSLTRMETAINRQIKISQQRLNVLAASPALKSPQGYILQRKQALELLQSRLSAGCSQKIQEYAALFSRLTGKLDAMSPLKVLSRGYAMAQQADGTLVRSKSQVTVGEKISVRLQDGSILTEVLSTEE